MNICGVLVHADPARIERVRASLATIEGLDVHEIADGGRIVVTVEDTAQALALDALAAIHKTDGVVAAALVYHHFEPSGQTAATE
ncbi:MAG: chaperone NapD [Hyphomicrobiaceae bacterium]